MKRRELLKKGAASVLGLSAGSIGFAGLSSCSSTKDLSKIPLSVRYKEALNQKGVNKALEPLFHSRVSRVIRKIKPKIINWESLENDPKYFGLKPPEGSVTLYWAPKKSGVIQELEDAYNAHDVNQLDKVLMKKLVDAYKSRTFIDNIEKAVSMLVDSPVYFDFVYSSKVLGQNLWIELDDRGVGSLYFPYNGGTILNEDFVILEHSKPDLERMQLYDYLIIKAPPKLTDAERAALDKVPLNSTEINIASSSTLAATPTALVTVAVFVAINTAVTTCCAPFYDKLSQIILPPELIERLGALASASQLVQLRAEIFEEFNVR